MPASGGAVAAGGTTQGIGGLIATGGVTGLGGNTATGGTSEPPRCATPDDVEVKALASGVYHTCVVTTTGGVRCWGDNVYGQLGDGTTNGRNIPTIRDLLTGA